MDVESAATSKRERVMRAIVLGLVLALSLGAFLPRADSAPLREVIVLGKQNLRLVFSADHGSLVGINDLGTGQQFIAGAPGQEGIWKLRLVAGSDTVEIGPQSAGSFTYRFDNQDSTGVTLIWTDFKPNTLKSMAVDVSVELTGHGRFSNWKISVDDFGDYALDRVWFPRIGWIAKLRDERLVVPQWMGALAKQPQKVFSGKPDPRRLEWSYPGEMSAQCVSVYTDGGPGLYLACDDTAGYRKSFLLAENTAGGISYEVESLPEKGITHENRYVLPYDGVVGTFTGDWFTVAQIYRRWATDQSWCKTSRFYRGEVPNWLQQTAVWVWNRGRSDVVLHPAEVLQDKLGLPVSVFWHWWHGCAYDAGFPEYFPPREGSRSFKNALSKAHTQGLHAILYMNQRLWGMTTKSWSTEHAGRFAVKTPDGKIQSHVYNIFTGQPMASMCIATSFWRSTYAGLAAKGINKYGADGIYMDQACTSLVCYDSTHGHPVGGGNYWINGFDSLTAQIRERNNSGRDILLAGEGCGENWLPHLDLFLTLQVSSERYARPDDGWESIPFFQAVYHPYAITYGSYSSLAYPPYDELWPKKYRPAETGKLLNERFSTQFYLEQARAFVWGMQPTIANFSPSQLTARHKEISYFFRVARTRYKLLQYLQYGKMERPPLMRTDNVMVSFSRISIYAGQQSGEQSLKKREPGILIGAWKAKDGSVAFPMASILSNGENISLEFHSKDYDLASTGDLYLVKDNGEKFIGSYNNGLVSLKLHLDPLEIFVVVVRPKNNN